MSFRGVRRNFRGGNNREPTKTAEIQSANPEITKAFQNYSLELDQKHDR